MQSTRGFTGIGGAGNYRRRSSVAPKSIDQSSTLSSRSGSISCGVGGAGNMHEATKNNTLALTKEIMMARSSVRPEASAIHFGRGGVGNVRFDRRGSSVSSGYVSAAYGLVSGSGANSLMQSSTTESRSSSIFSWAGFGKSN